MFTIHDCNIASIFLVFFALFYFIILYYILLYFIIFTLLYAFTVVSERLQIFKGICMLIGAWPKCGHVRIFSFRKIFISYVMKRFTLTHAHVFQVARCNISQILLHGFMHSLAKIHISFHVSSRISTREHLSRSGFELLETLVCQSSAFRLCRKFRISSTQTLSFPVNKSISPSELPGV